MAFFVKVDRPFNLCREVLGYRTADGGVCLLRGEATAAEKTEPDQVARVPFIHIYYLDETDPARIKTLRITSGPIYR
jgi:hypothetical protein